MKTTTLIGIAVVLTVVAGLLLWFISGQEQGRTEPVTSFEECAAAGYPIMESYPEQCRTPDGRTFVRDISNDEYDQMPIGERGGPGCMVAGCSGQLCVNEGDEVNIITTCEWRSEYQCYENARCEKQPNGKCGWTQTPELKQCLANPPALDAGIPEVY